MVYDPQSASMWGGGDRCPVFNGESSKLVSVPVDHPPVPGFTFPSISENNKLPSLQNDHHHQHQHSSHHHYHHHHEISPIEKDLHHHLPSPSSSIISPTPILYLPPLLSPLPSHIAHDVHSHGSGPSEEELSSFSTHLPDIDPASLSLHETLHNFQPMPSYASTAYPDAFNWDQLELDEDVEREWYCVVFRSRRNKESESLNLYKADREAHEEAVKNGGLILYWYGVPDETGMNLATCIWQSRRHAIKAISGPKHLLAMKHAQSAYEVYDLERWVLRKEKGERNLSLGKWTGGEVGW